MQFTLYLERLPSLWRLSSTDGLAAQRTSAQPLQVPDQVRNKSIIIVDCGEIDFRDTAAYKSALRGKNFNQNITKGSPSYYIMQRGYVVGSRVTCKSILKLGGKSVHIMNKE